MDSAARRTRRDAPPINAERLRARVISLNVHRAAIGGVPHADLLAQLASLAERVPAFGRSLRESLYGTLVQSIEQSIEKGIREHVVHLVRERGTLLRQLAAAEREIRRLRRVDPEAAGDHGLREMPDLAPLRDRYHAVDDPQVMAFFARHPEAVATLVEAHPHIVGVFDAGVTVRLEPSYFDDDDVLFAKVHGHGMDAVEALERFEEAFTPWWHTVPTERTVPLVIGVGVS
jgi:hypothetical protein